MDISKETKTKYFIELDSGEMKSLLGIFEVYDTTESKLPPGDATDSRRNELMRQIRNYTQGVW